MEYGYCSIGIYHPKTEVNIGTLWRTAYQLKVSYIFTIGKRYELQQSDVWNTQLRIPLFNYDTFDDYKKNLPKQCRIVAVEIGGKPLRTFHHPGICSYLLGAEDHGLPSSILEKCYTTVSIESQRKELSYNVAVAGSLVLYDRYIKRI